MPLNSHQLRPPVEVRPLFYGLWCKIGSPLVHSRQIHHCCSCSSDNSTYLLYVLRNDIVPFVATVFQKCDPVSLCSSNRSFSDLWSETKELCGWAVSIGLLHLTQCCSSLCKFTACIFSVQLQGAFLVLYTAACRAKLAFTWLNYLAILTTYGKAKLGMQLFSNGSDMECDWGYYAFISSPDLDKIWWMLCLN